MSLFRYLATDIREETKESNIPQTITKATMIMINSLFIRLTTLPTSFAKEYGSQKNQISDHTPKETEPNTILNKRLTNKERFCLDKLHRFNQKTLRIYGQMDGIPDQGKRNQHQCSPCYQQDQTDTPNIFIDHMHQRLLIRHLLHQFVLISSSR